MAISLVDDNDDVEIIVLIVLTIITVIYHTKKSNQERNNPTEMMTCSGFYNHH